MPTTEGPHQTGILEILSLIMGMMPCRMTLHALDFDMSGVYDEKELRKKSLSRWILESCEPRESETLRRQVASG